jgi:hypothetical protein
MGAIAVILIVGLVVLIYGIATAKDMPEHD